MAVVLLRGGTNHCSRHQYQRLIQFVWRKPLSTTTTTTITTKAATQNQHLSVLSSATLSGIQNKLRTTTTTTISGSRTIMTTTLQFEEDTSTNENGDESTTKATKTAITTTTTTTKKTKATLIDIEDLHLNALNNCSSTYIDPDTGYTVYTELLHLKRGYCCGNGCRHCPYGWNNVPKEQIKLKLKYRFNTLPNKKCDSGNINQTQQLITDIMKNSTNNDSNGSNTNNIEIKKNVPYTKRGDNGTSQLGTGEKVLKSDQIFEALGTVDELCSIIGVVHAQLVENSKEYDYNNLEENILDIMSRLLDIGSIIARPTNNINNNEEEIIIEEEDDDDNLSLLLFNEYYIKQLEEWINVMTEEMPELTSFILPTGVVPSAQLHVARTVCRRTERCMVPIIITSPIIKDKNILQYINRLSDFLFVAARYVNYCHNCNEIQYIKTNIDIDTSTTSSSTSNQKNVNVNNDNGDNNNNNNDSSTNNKKKNTVTYRERVSRSMQN